jgi:hypothetical protein
LQKKLSNPRLSVALFGAFASAKHHNQTTAHAQFSPPKPTKNGAFPPSDISQTDPST